MRYDFDLTLIGGTYIQDEYGNYAKRETETVVYCDLRSVTRTEFYSSAQAGLNPSDVFVIRAYEYNGENEVEFMGDRYAVIRTYRTDEETIELICEKKVVKDGGNY